MAICEWSGFIVEGGNNKLDCLEPHWLSNPAPASLDRVSQCFGMSGKVVARVLLRVGGEDRCEALAWRELTLNIKSPL
jgi:hypothetical protein